MPRARLKALKAPDSGFAGRPSLPSFLAGALVGVVAALLWVGATGTGLSTLARPGAGADANTVSPPPLPALAAVELTDPSCALCRPLDGVKAALRALDANLVLDEGVPYDGDKGRALAEKYGIRRVPALVVSGDTNALAALEPEEAAARVAEDGAVVFETARVPYRDLNAGRVRGLVGVVVVADNNCAACRNPLSVPVIQQALSSMAIPQENVAFVDAASPTGQALLSSRFLTFVPALILVGDYRDYASFKALEALGSFEADGSFVVRQPFPPYLDMGSGRVRGLVDLVLLQDARCWACWNAKDLYAGLTQNLGLAVQSVRAVEASSEEGRALVKAFSVAFLPAAIVRGDVAPYPGFEDAWTALGGRKAGEAFVLDSNTVLGPGFYLDAQTLQVVQAAQRPAAPLSPPAAVTDQNR